MNETKVCIGCQKEFPNTKEYFYTKNKDRLDTRCKTCKKVLSTEYTNKRRIEGKHLIHDCKCETCGVEFKGDEKSRRFCSVPCRVIWQSESQEYKNIMLYRDMTNMNKSVEVRELEYSDKFNDRFDGFEYSSGYENIDADINIMCKECGNTIKRNAHILHKGTALTCEHCKKKSMLIKSFANSINRISIDRQKAIRKVIDDEVAALKRIQSNHRYYCTCGECGKQYFNSKNQVHCSSKCTKRFKSRVNRMKREGRVTANGKVHWDISIEKIARRDGDACYLCGESCDTKDYTVRSDGTFIAGNFYPSIEHVIPISKGGTHTWDNVLLAHRYCNSVKGARVSN